MSEYVSKATPTKITATSRVSLKISDNFYTIEASEERSFEDDADMEKEWELLFDEVNSIVDNQQTDIINTFRRKK